MVERNYNDKENMEDLLEEILSGSPLIKGEIYETIELLEVNARKETVRRTLSDNQKFGSEEYGKVRKEFGERKSYWDRDSYEIYFVKDGEDMPLRDLRRYVEKKARNNGIDDLEVYVDIDRIKERL